MRRQPLVQSLIAAIAVGSCAIPAYATNWLQFGYDEAHSGFNSADHGYSTPTGNEILYHYALPTGADSAPIYVGGVATSAGTKNLLFVVSKNGTLFAVDADSKTLSVVWSKQPTGTGTLTTGSPAIDPGLQFVYAYGVDGKVHKYQIGDGTETTTSCAANTYDCWPEVSTLKPDGQSEKGASSLAIATTSDGNYLYSVTDGYIGDGGDYQGHITTINLSSGAQTVFNTECSDLTIHFVKNGKTSQPSQTDCSSVQNGIWGRPGAIYDAGTDRVFIATGNGPFDPTNAANKGIDWGDTVLAVHHNGTGGSGGNPVDSYTPSTFANLKGTDADLGSNSLAIIPAPQGSTYAHLGVIAGKDGCVRLIRTDNMSGSGAPGHTGGSLQSIPLDNTTTQANCDDSSTSGGSDDHAGEIRAQPAVWVNPEDSSTWVYVANTGSTLAAYEIVVTGGMPSLTQRWTANSGTSPVVANGTLFYMSSGHLLALDAVTGSSLLQSGSPWLSTAFSGPHWQSPIVVDGRLYLVDNNSTLWAFALDGIFKGKFD